MYTPVAHQLKIQCTSPCLKACVVAKEILNHELRRYMHPTAHLGMLPYKSQLDAELMSRYIEREAWFQEIVSLYRIVKRSTFAKEHLVSRAMI